MTWPIWMYRLDEFGDSWIAKDKAHHAGLSLVLFVAAAALVTNPLAGWFAVAVVGVGVEMIQTYRWSRWLRLYRKYLEWGGVSPDWPAFADKFSLKDLVADFVGAAVGHGLLLVARFVFG